MGGTDFDEKGCVRRVSISRQPLVKIIPGCFRMKITLKIHDLKVLYVHLDYLKSVFLFLEKCVYLELLSPKDSSKIERW